MKRRDFLSAVVAMPAAVGRVAAAAGWRTFEVKTTIDLGTATSPLRAWVDRPGTPVPRPADLARYLKPTTLIPTDGIVRDTAINITTAQHCRADTITAREM